MRLPHAEPSPGPWRVSKHRDDALYIEDVYGDTIAAVFNGVADALLIAAAYRMRDVLQRLVDHDRRKVNAGVYRESIELGAAERLLAVLPDVEDA